MPGDSWDLLCDFSYARANGCEAKFVHVAKEDEWEVKGRVRWSHRWYDDPREGLSHAPIGEDMIVLVWDMEDLRRWLEVVLDGVSEERWQHIQDEKILEQCVGGDPSWRSIVWWAVLVFYFLFFSIWAYWPRVHVFRVSKKSSKNIIPPDKPKGNTTHKMCCAVSPR